MIYIDDLVAAFRLAATTPGVAGEAFIIAGAERPTLEEVIRRIGRLTGHPAQKLVKLPAGPILLAGDLCEWLCRPFGITRRSTGAGSSSSSTTAPMIPPRPESRLGFAPKVEPGRRARPHARLVSAAGPGGELREDSGGRLCGIPTAAQRHRRRGAPDAQPSAVLQQPVLCAAGPARGGACPDRRGPRARGWW